MCDMDELPTSSPKALMRLCRLMRNTARNSFHSCATADHSVCQCTRPPPTQAATSVLKGIEAEAVAANPDQAGHPEQHRVLRTEDYSDEPGAAC